jgi:hypothetical protein
MLDCRFYVAGTLLRPRWLLHVAKASAVVHWQSDGLFHVQYHIQARLSIPPVLYATAWPNAGMTRW